MTVNNFKQVQAQSFSLSGAGAVAGATSVILRSFEQIDGTQLTMTDFGSIGYGTLEPGNGTLEEQISFTGVTQNSGGTATLTGVKTVLMVSPYTETSGLAQTHAGSTTFVLSNTAGYYGQFAKKNADSIITGKYTFPEDNVSNAGITTDVDTSVATAFVTLGQLSRQAISGASDASTTVKGIVQLPTQAQVDARTTTGSTSALLALTPDKQRTVLMHDYIASATGTDDYAITCVPAVTAYTTGDVYYFKADVANVGDATGATLAVNGLSAIPLKTSKSLIPPTNYIVAGSLVTCQYDGTNMQILSPQSTSQLSQSGKEIYGASATGNDTYVITLQPTPIAYAKGQVFRFSPGTVNTGAATLNVNGLGALNILRTDGSALADGDLASGGLYQVAVFDGTTAYLISPTAVAPIYKNGIDSTWAMDTASASLTIAHGLGRTPRRVRISASIGGTTATVTGTSYGVFNGTTTSSTASGGSSSTNILSLVSASATPHTQVATCAVDATNITLAFTRGGTNGTEIIAIVWEAEA